MMEKKDLIERIIQYYRTVNRAFTQYDPDAWMGISISIAQVKTLFFIADEKEVNFRKLAFAMNVTPSNVTGVVDRLVEQGLLTRTENPSDRRMLMIKLTDKGETLITGLRESRTNQICSVLNRMTPEDLKIVAQGYSLLKRAVEKRDG
jgi:MarR family transcriptional regulator, organic hydroperoxide resistance regulator